MPTIESQPIGSTGTPPQAAFGLPTGTMTWAVAATILGIALVTYAARRWKGAPARAMGVHAEADVMSDMRELSERLAGELNERAEHLERLLARADARIVELKEASRGHVPAAPQAASEFDEVYALAEQGLTAVEIARRTHRPTGQVQLILNLRGHASAAG